MLTRRLVALLLAASASAAFADVADLDARIERAAADGRFVGLSIAVLGPTGEIFRKHYGRVDIADARPPDDRTLYEIGSLTKVFTRLLLAMDDLPLADPLSAHLPAGVRAPTPGGQEIRIQDLALHTGFRFGAPCVLSGPTYDEVTCYGVELGSSDPYRHVTRADLFRYVDAYAGMLDGAPPELFREPGAYEEYSNAGMGLLGELLAARHKTTYADWLQRTLLAPLQLDDTFLDMPCEAAGTGSCAALAKVYRRDTAAAAWAETSLWHVGGLAGAGALRSSLGDMTRFLAAEMAQGAVPDAVARGIERGRQPLPDADAALAANLCTPVDPDWAPCNRHATALYLGWPSASGRTLFFHAGETGGSQAMMLMARDRSLGVVILGNSVPAADPEGVAHLPNDLALCVAALAGRLPSAAAFCAAFPAQAPAYPHNSGPAARSAPNSALNGAPVAP